MLVGEPRLVRPAALAGPEPGALGIGAGGVERHILTPRQPRGTARATIDPGCLHRIDEGAVGRAIAPLDGAPTRIIE
jgi:hypothetical protein